MDAMEDGAAGGGGEEAMEPGAAALLGAYRCALAVAPGGRCVEWRKRVCRGDGPVVRGRGPVRGAS